MLDAQPIIDPHHHLWDLGRNPYPWLQDRALAPRLDTLEGKTVAQLWDQLFKGDEVFDLLEEGLKKKYPGVKFVSWREFGSTHSGDEKEALAALP